MGDTSANTIGVDDFFSTIEEAGLGDIAAEVGLGIPQARQDSARGLGVMGAGSSSHDVNGYEAPGMPSMSVAPMDSPPRVLMPHCSSSGPSVPAELQGALGAGDNKKKRGLGPRGGGGKGGDKGLRHFSMKVCEKVEQKGRTTYNEVADELVAEFAVAATEMVSTVDQAYDEKNIRRRVYDALNVLMAMDIITKEKKSIMWHGLPTNTEQEGARLQMDLSSRSERVTRKKQHLQELLSQQVSFKQLIARNQANPAPPASASSAACSGLAKSEAADADGGAASGSVGEVGEASGEPSRISLPFILVNTRQDTVIDCEMAEDRREIFFNFSAPFEIHDDSETLKRMRMQRCTPETLNALVPQGLAPFAAECLAPPPEAAPPVQTRNGRSRGGS